MSESSVIRFGDTTIQYQVRRSGRRKKTVEITVDGGGVQVAAPMATPESELTGNRKEAGALDSEPCVRVYAGSSAQEFRQRRDACRIWAATSA